MKKYLSTILALIILLSCTSALCESTVGPFEPYPETVTVRVGRKTSTNLMEDGITESGNLYADYLLETSNVVVEPLWTVDESTYNTRISLGIASGDLPDIFMVDNEQQLKMLVENDLLADLSGTYETKAADYIKDFYASYGEDAFNTATFDGKLMAVPDLNYGYQFMTMWIRQDWLKELNLEIPTTVEETLNVVRAFIENDMSGNGDTVGLLCQKEVAGFYNAAFLMDPIMNTFGSYPRSWLVQEDGSIAYGTIQPETKEALAFVAEMYKEGLIDKEFAVRDWDTMMEMMLSGRVGVAFGAWHLPYGMSNMKVIDPDSDWIPVLAPLSADGKMHPMEQQLHKNYMCVRKGYEHPEVVWELLNYEWLRGSDPKIVEIENYYTEQLGADVSVAKPWSAAGFGSIMCQWNDAVPREGKAVLDAINNGYDTTGLSVELTKFTESARRYLEDGDATQWVTYVCRVLGCAVSSDYEKIETRKVSYPSMTDTMSLKWASLETLEDEMMLKIVMGEEPIEYFDTFVEQWNAMGGAEIVEEVNEMYGAK